MINANAIQATEQRIDGFTYRAEMLPNWRPAYVGAARETRYYRFNGSWELLAYSQLPRRAYRQLRKGLALDATKGEIV